MRARTMLALSACESESEGNCKPQDSRPRYTMLAMTPVLDESHSVAEGDEDLYGARVGSNLRKKQMGAGPWSDTGVSSVFSSPQQPSKHRIRTLARKVAENSETEIPNPPNANISARVCHTRPAYVSVKVMHRRRQLCPASRFLPFSLPTFLLLSVVVGVRSC